VRITWRRQADHEATIRGLFERQGFPEASIPKVHYGYIAGREELHALVSRENLGGNGTPDWRWHISLSAQGRVPNWEELSTAAHDLRPGVPMTVGVPPKSWWLNVHPDVLHLYETKDANLLAQWRHERRGDAPT
jgi:hypothetical protein